MDDCGDLLSTVELALPMILPLFLTSSVILASGVDLSEVLQETSRSTIAVVVVGDHGEEATSLRRWSPMAHESVVQVVSREGSRAADLTTMRLWRTEVQGGVALVTVNGGDLRGFTLRQGELHSLVLDGNRLREVDANTWSKGRVPCAGAAAVAMPSPFDSDQATTRAAGDCRVLRVAFDTDWDFTNTLFAGDADDAAAYVLEVAAAVSVIYGEELNLTVEVAHVRTWADEASCPYDPTEQTNTMLDQFRSEWETNPPETDRHAAHLMSGSHAPASAGQAWMRSVCRTTGYSFSSQIDGDFGRPPVDHSWNIWDLLVVSHEIGHTLGANHTHQMIPPIDQCGNGDCSEAWGGTIMSYCHTCLPHGTRNVVLAFHPRVRADIDAYLETIDSESCPVGPASADINGDGVVGRADLIHFLSVYGTCSECGCGGDLDHSGSIDVLDLLRMLEVWG